MKHLSKLALIAASAVVVASSAQAGNGDIVIGFTGAASDYIFDVGAVASLSQGETWNLGTILGSGINSSTGFGAVGYQTTGRHIYATSSDSAENGFVLTAGSGTFNAIRPDIDVLYGSLTSGTGRTETPSSGSGWTFTAAQPNGTPGAILQNDLFNTPNVAIGSTAYFFDNFNGNAAVADSFFTYNTTSGILQFGAAVPEPSTYGLFAGMGLLALALRRKLVNA